MNATLYVLNPAIRLVIKQGDLTLETVDVIVNAANRHLQHGGGLAFAILQRGGPSIQRESDQWISQYGVVDHRTPAVTGTGNLSCRYIFHAVGPVWGSGHEESRLQQTIIGCLEKMEALQLHSIAFPAISTGIYGFPMMLAAQVFFRTLRQFSKDRQDSCIQEIRLVLYNKSDLDTFLSVSSDFSWEPIK
jgi:O-acetyl-ADP-ribose deacetylase (regulator of RNase III)